jgi:hypothetical protein
MATANQSSVGPKPRTLHGYLKPRHVRERFADPRRPITSGLAADAVRRGTVEGNPIDRSTDAWRFRHGVEGCDVVVGAAEAREPHRDYVVLTAYIDVADARVAWSSTAWSNEEVNTAALLQYLKGDKPVADSGLHPKRIHVTDPVDYHGHRLINKNGYSMAVCVDCKFESEHGDRYNSRPCYG